MIPKMRYIPIPPPLKMPNKNFLWQRYSKGEKLIPTYDPFFLKSKVIPPPPRPQEPRSIKQGGIDRSDIIFFVVIIGAFLISVICSIVFNPSTH
jgi:hypothetical protein